MGIIVLPLMIFHQVQLMVCSFIAQRYKKKNDAALKASAPQGKAIVESQK